MSGIFAATVLIFMISTAYIVKFEGGIGKVVKTIWILAFIINIVTSYFGNLEILFTNDADGKRLIFLLFATILTSTSGILASQILDS